MAQVLTEAIRMVWRYTTQEWQELCQHQMHTGHFTARDSPEASAEILDVMESVHASLGGACAMAQRTLNTVSLQRWDDTNSDWIQYSSRDVETLFGDAVDELPPQLAIAVGYRAGLQTEPVPIGRRRNRFYAGPLNTNAREAGGRIGVTRQSQIFDAMQDFHTQLLGTTGGATEEDGLCVVSVAHGGLFPAEAIAVGRGIDTIRSRRQKVNEAMVITPLT